MGIIGLVVDDPAISRRVVWVILIPDLHNFFGVLVVLGKDDGFPHVLAEISADAVRHKRIQHLADGIDVENPLIEGGTVDPFGDFPIFGRKAVLKFGFLLLGEFIIRDA